jgi:hypothetical protein
MIGFPHLSETSIEQTLTAAGMAHFAGTGPSAKTCGDCAFKGYWRRVVNASGDFVKNRRTGGCAKYFALTARHGPAITKYLPACRYFEPAEAPVVVQQK